MTLKMKTLLRLLAAFAVLPCFGAESVSDHLFSPDLLVFARDEVPLTEEQRRILQEVTGRMEARFGELQERLKRENDILAVVVKPERVSTAAALEQLERVLEIEREIRKLQLGFMLAIKQQLTPEQQEKLNAFRKANGLDRESEELQRRLVAKADRVRAGLEKLAGSGGDPKPVAGIMDEARKLMEQGKKKEAEEAIDRALKQLGK